MLTSGTVAYKFTIKHSIFFLQTSPLKKEEEEEEEEEKNYVKKFHFTCRNNIF